MKSLLKQSLKLFALSLTIAVIFTLSQSAAQAQELMVDGSTTGSTFDNGTNSLGGLSFKGTNFGGTTSGGVLVLNNLGTLTITPIPSTSTESVGTFTFEVAFTRPDGVSVNPVEVSGTVFALYTDADSFALIDFENDAKTVTFSGANGTGAFSIALDDVCLGVACALFDRSDLTDKLRRHKSLNARALNNAQRGDGNVKFVKAKASSSMFQSKQTFTITATITILQECASCVPPIPPFLPIGSPTNEGQCKNDRWRIFNDPPFKNQGDCVSFVNPQ